MRPRFSAAIASLAARSAAALSRWTHRVGVSSRRRLLWQADPRLATLRHTHHNTQGSRRLARTIFKDEHELFRKTVSAFIDREIAPHYERWEKEGQVSREVWRKAGEAGLLLSDIPPEYGGAGADFLYSAVMIEEMAKRVYAAPGFRLHSDIVAPYIFNYGTEEQKRTWLPRMAKGEVISAIAMTEPGTGSDLQAIRTTALRKGNELVVNGQKVFITNGGMADLVIVAAKTDTSAGAKGSPSSWSRPTAPASSAAATSRRSARTHRTPPSCSSRTCACRPPISWARRAAASPA